ncbi:putative MFS lactose permease [Coniella lustricola]|uniref:Putative MFS lactose permease n=1 Tax=Coniella lustricola TaxID=2025994 RepID=A0A2T3AJM0_9PEZI|nr:putative MFS lactose permease [Coniella lustricola]
MTEKSHSIVGEAQHGISDETNHGISHETHFPVVAEGTGKTLDTAAGAKAKQVHNAELFAAVQETKIERWSKSSIKLYFAVLVAFACACANGYDGSLIGSITAMDSFRATFHTELTGTKVSIISSLYNVGNIVVSPFAAILSDRLGRRWTMFTGAWVIIIGAIIACTSSTIAQLIVGRVLLGSGIAIMTVAAPAYAIEIAPAHWRGRCTGFYNCGWFGGSIPAAFVTFGCSYMKSNWAWRVPLLLQCFACFIVIASVFFLPESPRFLMANGREEEAVAFLVKYHGNGDPSSRLVLLEIEEMKENIRQDGLDKVWWDYRPMFTTHNGRWRFAQIVMISVFGQFSGNGLGYFNAAIFDLIGVKSTAQQLGFNVLNSVLSAMGAGVGVSLSDKMNRRTVLTWGTLACAGLLAVNGGASTGLKRYEFKDSSGDTGIKPAGKPLAQAALAFYFMFNIIYSFTYTPLQGIIPAEALDTNLRAKGLAASGMIVGLFGFINTFAGPIALSNINTNYVYVFVAWDVIESLLWWLFCVESQGRTLEQLEWVYNQPKPVQASIKVDKVVVQADGKVTEKIVAEGASA